MAELGELHEVPDLDRPGMIGGYPRNQGVSRSDHELVMNG